MQSSCSFVLACRSSDSASQHTLLLREQIGKHTRDIALLGIAILIVSIRLLAPNSTGHLTLIATMSTRGYPEHESLQHVHHHKSSNKRKRESSDHTGSGRRPGSRQVPPSNNVHGNGQDTSNSSHDPYSDDSNNHDFTSMSEQLSRHIANANANVAPTTAAAALAASMPQLTVPQPTDFSFSNSGSGTDPDRQLDSSFDMGGGSDEGPNHHTQGTPYNLDAYQGGAGAHGQDADNGGKPAVGSEEWHKVRRDNHKEGEFSSSSITTWAYPINSGTKTSRNHQRRHQ